MSSTGFIVIGLNRSGTSAIAAALHALGVYFGESPDLHPSGPRLDYEHFEHVRVAEMLSSLQAAFATGGRPFEALPANWRTFSDAEDDLVAAAGLIQTTFCGHPVWAWKEPRGSLLLPFMEGALAKLDVETRYLMPVRHPNAIAEGLAKRQYMPRLEALGHATHFMLTILTEAPLERMRLAPLTELIHDPRALLEPLWKEMALGEPGEDAWRQVREAVRPDLDRSVGSGELPAITERTWNAVRRLPVMRSIDRHSEAYQELLAIKAEWDEMRSLTSMPNASYARILWRCGTSKGVIDVLKERVWLEATIEIPPNSGGRLELNFTALFVTFYLRRIRNESTPEVDVKVGSGQGAFLDYAHGRIRVSPYAPGAHLTLDLPDQTQGASIRFEIQLEKGTAPLYRTGTRLANELAAKSGQHAL